MRLLLSAALALATATIVSAKTWGSCLTVLSQSRGAGLAGEIGHRTAHLGAGRWINRCRPLT